MTAYYSPHVCYPNQEDHALLTRLPVISRNWKVIDGETDITT